MRILEIKFERNWNFENYLRVRDLKKIKLRKFGPWKKSELKVIWEAKTMEIELCGNLENHSEAEFLEMNE